MRETEHSGDWGRGEGLHWIVRRPHQGLKKTDGELGVSTRVPGLSLWLSGKESTCQCRRHGSNPWVGTIPWRRTWQPIPVFLPGTSHGQRSLGATLHEITKELDLTWQLNNNNKHELTMFFKSLSLEVLASRTPECDLIWI